MKDNVNSYTVRETSLILALSRGLSRSRIAEELGIAQSTVDKYLRQLRERFRAASHAELVMYAGQIAPKLATSRPTSGIRPNITARAMASGQDPASPNVPLSGSDFQGAETFDALFDKLIHKLTRWNVAWINYSHIRIGLDQRIEHVGGQWNFPTGVTYDWDIRAEENLAVQHAFRSWEPLPLDLEALLASPMAAMLPPKVAAQNTVFMNAGMVRGLIVVLPGMAADDRLFVSLIFDDTITSEVFAQHVAQYAPILTQSLMIYRGAHVALAQRINVLDTRQSDLVNLLIEGQNLDDACDQLDVSRRTGERSLAMAREKLGVTSNTALVARVLELRAHQRLPFGSG